MSYIGNEPIVSATRTVTEVTATAGQTVFTANGGYTVGFLDVFINGSKLTSADFTATNGTTVTLTEAAQVSDIVRLEALGTFLASNGVAKTGDTMTGALLLPDGSASAPALSNDGDSNTGIFFPAADTIAFAEGGTESMRINSSGDVGIGTTSFAGATKVTIKQSSTVGLAVLSNTNDAGVYLWNDGTKSIIGSSYEVSAGYTPLTFQTNSTECMRLTNAGLLQFNSGYGSVATAYGCRAWVNFNGTGTVAIRASGNVSSITDNGTGQYTVNFTNSMPDTNYATSISQGYGTTGADWAVYHERIANKATSSTRIFVANNTASSFFDVEGVYVAIFR